jgi:hypothetical protein
MKIEAVNSETVLRRLRAAGLTGRQATGRLNRALLCLDYIGEGKRVGTDIFNCFSGELRVKGHRLRFHQVLIEAKLIKQTRPHIQSLYCAEYRAIGKAIEQEVELNRSEAQIMRKIKAINRKAQVNDKTIQWLNQAIKHTFEGGCYFSMAKGLEWPSVSLQRAFAGIAAEGKRRLFLGRYFRKLREDGSIQLEDEDGGKSYRKAELSADYREVSEVLQFADSLHGEPCTTEDLQHLQEGRVARMVSKKGFDNIKRRSEKLIVERLTADMRSKSFLCATDGSYIYAENAEALEQAFVHAVDYVLHVDITRRDEPILTPLYIHRLRLLKAKKEGKELSEIPRAMAEYWQPKTHTTTDGRELFKRKQIAPDITRLRTVKEAKAFYGVDPDIEAAEAVTLQEARLQIERWGSVKASNAKFVTAQLYEMGHALPTEPTEQQWELSPKGMEWLLASSAKSTAKPLPEQDRAENYTTYTMRLK